MMVAIKMTQSPCHTVKEDIVFIQIIWIVNQNKLNLWGK